MAGQTTDSTHEIFPIDDLTALGEILQQFRRAEIWIVHNAFLI